jgi:glucuronate isomerase
MLHDHLAQELYSEICRIPLVDAHTHINPRRPTARNLDEILSYHYYTELAHSAGMEPAVLAPDADPRERVRALLYYMNRFDNTAQYQWFMEIVRAFLNFQGERVTIADSTWLCDTAEQLMADPDWEQRVLHLANIDKVFLTNEFDDPLEGFDRERYIPCLRTDDLVFRLYDSDVRQRLAAKTGIEPTQQASLERALDTLFEQFKGHGAKACAISLPPDFAPGPVSESDFAKAFAELSRNRKSTEVSGLAQRTVAHAVFWSLAKTCEKYQLPFDLMIGVNRGVYHSGVFQGQDLFDQRTSLIQYAPLFNAFPEVTFCVSVLSSGQNQELVSYSWLFPNVVTSGHWWYSNIPAYIEQDARARLQAVPKTKQIGYYSDMYKLEFGLPKFNMYRRILAQILADDFVRPRLYSEVRALELARLLLRDNARRIFNV